MRKDKPWERETGEYHAWPWWRERLKGFGLFLIVSAALAGFAWAAGFYDQRSDEPAYAEEPRPY